MEEVRGLFESSRSFLDEKLDLVADVICARRRLGNSSICDDSSKNKTAQRSRQNYECRAEGAEADHTKSPVRPFDELLDKLLLSLAATWSIVQASTLVAARIVLRVLLVVLKVVRWIGAWLKLDVKDAASSRWRRGASLAGGDNKNKRLSQNRVNDHGSRCSGGGGVGNGVGEGLSDISEGNSDGSNDVNENDNRMRRRVSKRPSEDGRHLGSRRLSERHRAQRMTPDRCTLEERQSTNRRGVEVDFKRRPAPYPVSRPAPYPVSRRHTRSGISENCRSLSISSSYSSSSSSSSTNLSFKSSGSSSSISSSGASGASSSSSSSSSLSLVSERECRRRGRQHRRR